MTPQPARAIIGQKSFEEPCQKRRLEHFKTVIILLLLRYFMVFLLYSVVQWKVTVKIRGRKRVQHEENAFRVSEHTA